MLWIKLKLTLFIHLCISEIRIRCEHLLDEAIRIGSFARKEMEDAMNDTNIEVEIMMMMMMMIMNMML